MSVELALFDGIDLHMDQAALEKVMRYESHLNKQLHRTLDLLKRFQLHRLRCSPPLAGTEERDEAVAENEAAEVDPVK